MMRVLIAGLGNMGRSHALAHHYAEDAVIVGLVNQSGKAPEEPLDGYTVHTDFHQALKLTRPDLVVIATYSDTHAEYAIAAMQQGAHVFVEKPLANTVSDAKGVIQVAEQLGRKLVVGYILRHHPSWQQFVAEAKALGGPYVFRMNLNQQSTGADWETHKKLMLKTSPIVDCGVHYVDIMCQITDSHPTKVNGIGLRLTNQIAESMYNYGQFQVSFSDGSVGWYEAGWGPMVSETANFVKDVFSPNGAVSISESWRLNSASVDDHTSVGALVVHRLEGDSIIDLPAEPNHQDLCDTEQSYMRRAITENIDLARHMQDAVQSLEICLAADESIRSGKAIELTGALK